MSLRVCIIGAGTAALDHVRTLAAIDSDVRVSVAARQLGRADAFRAAHGLDLAYRSIDEVWSSDEHLVVIATPPSAHLSLLEAALRADKHVLVESPAFASADELRRAQALLAGSTRLFMVAERSRFAPGHRAIVERVAAGAIGELVAATIQRFDVAPHAGLLEDGIHWIGRALELSGVRSVRELPGIFALAPSGGASREPVVLSWKSDSGVIGELWHAASMPSRGGVFDLSRVVGTRGSIAFDLAGKVALQLFGESARPIPLLSLEPWEDPSGLHAMWRRVLGSIELGTPPEHSLESASLDRLAIDAALRSLASGQVEPVG